MAKKSEESVEDFLQKLKHPMMKEIEALRKIILSADKRLTEKIKWNAPSYCFNDGDRITLNLSGKGVIRIIFHCGVKSSDKKLKAPLFNDITGLLNWAAHDRAIAQFNSLEEIQANKKALTQIVKKWIDVTA